MSSTPGFLDEIAYDCPRSSIAEEDTATTEDDISLFDSDDDHNDDDLESSDDSSGVVDLPVTRRCWQRNFRNNMPLNQEGNDFLKTLKKTGGKIIWMKGNYTQVKCFAGDTEFYRFQIKSRVESEDLFTMIGKSWVLENILNLHHYPFTDTLDGHYHIYEALDYVCQQ